MIFHSKETRQQISISSQEEEVFLWRESLYSLSRIHYNELRPLGSLERVDLLKLWSYCAFRKFDVGHTLSLQKGGILLDGNKILKK